jgi:hypothetical protein
MSISGKKAKSNKRDGSLNEFSSIAFKGRVKENFKAPERVVNQQAEETLRLFFTLA